MVYQYGTIHTAKTVARYTSTGMVDATAIVDGSSGAIVANVLAIQAALKAMQLAASG